MARGQKYSDKIKERAYALADCGNTLTAIAKVLKIPRTTVKGWLKKRNETVDANAEDVRKKNKERFVNDAWRSIHAGNAILVRRLERAVGQEDEMDRLLDEFLSGTEELTDEQRRDLLRKFNALKVEDIGKIAVTLGTLYDKQALIAKEATDIIGLERRFEDF